MQVTGAYKIRGAYYKISTLSQKEREKGLITASAGNHAQGVAYAAKAFGVKAVIVMPTTTPLIKVERTKSYGAEVVLYGDVYDEACDHAYELAEKYGLSIGHLSTLIKKETGMSFTEYITEKRMEDAKKLLLKEELSIEEVAEKVGYHDYFYFTKAFKK